MKKIILMRYWRIFFLGPWNWRLQVIYLNPGRECRTGVLLSSIWLLLLLSLDWTSVCLMTPELFAE